MPSRFRPCIDLHDGRVKQIVGATLRDNGGDSAEQLSNRDQDLAASDVAVIPTATEAAAASQGLRENFVSPLPAAHYAQMYAADRLAGGHLIKLGPGNDQAALEALASYPGGLQIGGGINLDNAAGWLDAGASHVIVTSMLFDLEGRFQTEKLQQLVARIGSQRLVIDLSCQKENDSAGWRVMMNRWQTPTELKIDFQTLDWLARSCDQFLIHAAHVEGLCGGIDRELVQLMGAWGQIPLTYAGGAASLDDVKLVNELSLGKVDVTIGSALDIFGGTGVKYSELLDWNHAWRDC